MKITFNGIAILAILFASCTSKSEDKITGVYVYEHSYDEKKLSTEEILGKVIVLDSILITKKEKGFQIENRVWKNRLYGQEGWQRYYETAMKPHAVSYDKTDHSLNTELGLYNPMYLDVEKGLLFFSKESSDQWKKVPTSRIKPCARCKVIEE